MTPGSSGPRRCAQCGALAARLDARFCEYCGTALPVPAPAPAPAPTDTAARFRALAAHPELPRLLAHVPESRALAGRGAVTLATLVFFGVVGLFVTVVFFLVCPPFGLLPLALVGLGGYTLSRQYLRTTHARGAPLERHQALVVDKRTRISGGGEHSAARTEYFATLEQQDGSRRESETFDEVAGRIVAGDMGVAYLRGDFLIAFERLRV
jgi:hypothetical protein